MILISLGIPSWDGWVRAELMTSYFEALTSQLSSDRPGWAFCFFGIRIHVSIEAARQDFCDTLRCKGGGADLLVMCDADQAFDGPWMTQVVDAYRANRHAIHFGVTPLGYQETDPEMPDVYSTRGDGWVRSGNLRLNYSLDDSGRVRRCGAGLLAIPSAAYAKILESHANPWYHESGDIRRGEDILFIDRARECGVEILPIPGLSVSHWPEWREPLRHTEVGNGRKD